MPDNPDLYAAEVDLEHPPVWALPKSFEDHRNHRIIDGWYVAGHAWEMIDGKPCIIGECEPSRPGPANPHPNG